MNYILAISYCTIFTDGGRLRSTFLQPAKLCRCFYETICDHTALGIFHNNGNKNYLLTLLTDWLNYNFDILDA